MGKNILLLTLALFFSTLLTAQPTLSLGQWNSYLPYRASKYITQSASKVYFATSWSVMVWDKDESYSQRFSKVDGLTQAGVSLVKFHEAENTLIVVFDDGTIDLVQEEGITTLFDIPNFQGPIGDKNIFDIFIDEDNGGVYLAANYGVSKLDISTPEFNFTTFTGVPVNAVGVFDGYLYAATEEGIYRIEQSNSFPEDLAQWEYVGMDYGLPGDYYAGPMTTYNDHIYFAVEDTLFAFDGEQAEFVHYEESRQLNYLTSEGARLLAGFYCEGCQGTTLYFNPDLSYTSAPANCIDRPLYALEDEQGNVWFSDLFQKFRVHYNGTDSCERFNVNSPYSHRIQEVHISGDDVWVASGGVKTNFNYLFIPDGIFWYINGVWGEYNLYNTSEFSGLFDFYTITSHPETGVVYAGSFLDGLVEIDRPNKIINVYNDSNSTLNNPPLDSNRTRVSGLAFDQDYNLWISNHAAERPISVYTNEGDWMSFKPSCFANELVQVVVDQNGYKWFMIGADNAGLLIFDEGELTDPTDDRCRILTDATSNLPTNRVKSLAVDLDGDVWVGTEEGVVVFECGGNVFDETCQGSLRIVEQDNFGAYLLETENVRTIAVDGANRKWFGTDNGIFVQSPNGEEQIAFLDENNSPLFDNIISDIEIHPVTGEVLIGTNKGLISLRGEATEGPDFNTNLVNVFPNPVRPDYEGPIAISGLARDANVKITDIHGTLMYETTALGGQAVWDGRDYTGRRASTGVYLVFSTSTQSFDQPDTVVAKIVFVN
jgi:streptogramin lyase